jgi:basic membrane lipoprotein Med (substrate-binding protein (PBP1-ABC) superfamily)
VKGQIRRWGFVALAAVVLAGVLAACGSSSSNSKTKSSASTSASSTPAASTPSTASTASTPSTSTTTSGSNFKVGLVTDIGGLNDHGFNHLAYLGLQAAEKQLGVKGTVLQSTSGADYVPNLTKLAAAGNNLVISVGFLMANATAQVAKQYPNVHFAIIDNDATTEPGKPKNIEGLLFREQQAGYLVAISPASTPSRRASRRSRASAARRSRPSTTTSPATRRARRRRTLGSAR